MKYCLKSCLLLAMIVGQFGVLKSMAIIGEIEHCFATEIALNVLFGRFHFQSDNISIPINEKGQFTVNVSINEIRMAELQISNVRIPIFMKPGEDTLFLYADWNDIKNTLVFDGKLGTANHFLNARSFPNYLERFAQLESEVQSDPELIDSIFIKSELEELKQFKKIESKLDDESLKFLKTEISSYYLIIRLKAGLEYGYRDLEVYNEKWRSRNASLLDSIDCTPINHFGTYYNHLIASWYDHLRLSFYADLQKDSLYWIKKFAVKSVMELEEVLAKDKYNKIYYIISRDQLCPKALEKGLSNKIYRSIEDGDFENLLFIYDQFKKEFPSSDLLGQLEMKMDIVRENLLRMESDSEEILFYSNDLEYTSLDEILGKVEFQNKVVVVDIWGTWCGPCREEFQYLASLKQQLKNKDVEFLYLAHEKVPNPVDHWQETAKYYNLTGFHYLLNDDVLNDYWNLVEPGSKIRSYPNYMIIGKDGKVELNKASLPSDGDKLYQEIIKALDKD